VPINTSEGYLFINTNPKKDTQVYEYAVTMFENAYENYKGIRTQFITTYKTSTSNTFENIKLDLIKHYKKLPNPATYGIKAQLDFPLHETILPIAKRVLVKEVSKTIH
jgi:hypothetical protein